MGGLKGLVGTALLLAVLGVWGYFGVSMLLEAAQRADFVAMALPMAILFIPLAFAGVLMVFVVCAVIPSLRQASDDRKGIVGVIVAVLLGTGLVGYAWTAGRGEFAQVAAALGPACQGQAIANAGALDVTGTIANHIVVLDESGNEWLWTYGTPAEWRPPTVADAELVACVPKEDTLAAIEVCRYRNGPNVTRYRNTRAIRVFEARSGRSVASFSITLEPRACRQTEDLSLTELRGESVTWPLVQNRLASFVARGVSLDPHPQRSID